MRRADREFRIKKTLTVSPFEKLAKLSRFSGTEGRVYSVVVKRFSEISFSPLHVKGNNGFFDGYRTSPLVSFAPPPYPSPSEKM